MRRLSILLAILAPVISHGQSLPREMHYSTDGKILYTGGVTPTGLYDKSSVKEVYLNFPQTNYWTLLTGNYASETNIAATMIYDTTTVDSVGVRFRGNTSYTMIGNSQKKSFSVETDWVHPDQKIMGYNNLKFNNAAEDPSFMREVLYNRMANRHMPVAKGNYIHLFLNNQDWGLYPNIQSVDKNFLEEWFMSNDGARFRATTENTGTPNPNWGDGTAGMNYLGAAASTYQQYYSLKSNDIVVNPWQTLIDACSTLSVATSSNTANTLSKIDVDKALWFLACENIFTDDDSYIMKGKMDYMIYYEPETGRTTPLEYDGNSTFETQAATSSAWGVFKNATNANYPLLYKLLAIPQWRQRYLAHYRTILNETFTTTNANALIDEINTQISGLVASDPKKLFTTAQYTSGVPALKNFVLNRRAYLLTNTEVAQVAPVIASAKFYNSSMNEYAPPAANEVVNIKVPVASTTGISAVNLYYASGTVGNFTKTQMYDDGAHNDGAAADGTYGAQIPGYASGSMVRYYVEAVANNAALSASYLPTGAEHDIFVYTVTAITAPNGVVINELMAKNTNVAKDEAGDYEDWVELYNNNNYAVDLSGFYLSDNTTNLTKWQFPTGTSIAANGYLIVWADNEATEGNYHASWKLSDEGESVSLADTAQHVVDQVIFGTQTENMAYARVPNGTGNFLIQVPTFDSNNVSNVTPPPTGINNNTVSPGTMLVYPNPARDMVYMNLSAELMKEYVSVYNYVGQRIYYTKANEKMVLNTLAWTPGVYIIKCGQIIKKITIK